MPPEQGAIRLPTQSTPAKPQRILTVDALRGVAALSVAWYHFTHGAPAFLKSGLLKSSGTFGWLGLFIFFVLSGFVIPHALHCASFRPARLGPYLLKRLVRLDPPYLVTIGVVILLNYASAWHPSFRGTPFDFSWPQFLSHLGYANALIGYAWYNPVFWTLAIEFQWYLFAALSFVLISSSCPWQRWVAFGLCAGLPCIIPPVTLLFRHLPVFAAGMAAFQWRAGLIQKTEYAILLVAFGMLSGLIFGGLVGVTAAGTALAISFLKLQQRWLLALGAISYSLYLLHVPIGGRVINLGTRLPDSMWIKAAFLVSAVLVSLAAAFLLWKFIERPAVRWAARLSSDNSNKP